MRNYEAVNDYIIGLSRRDEVKTTSGILLATEARKTNRVLEVVESDDEKIVKGDKIIVDLSAGSILEDGDEGTVIAVNSSDVIAKIKD